MTYLNLHPSFPAGWSINDKDPLWEDPKPKDGWNYGDIWCNRKANRLFMVVRMNTSYESYCWVQLNKGDELTEKEDYITDLFKRRTSLIRSFCVEEADKLVPQIEAAIEDHHKALLEWLEAKLKEK